MAHTPLTPPVHRRAVLALIVTAALAVLVGLYQWIELVQLRSGGAAPLCSFSATFDCVGVWNSALAGSVHKTTGLPFPAWGLAWGVVVLVLAVGLFRQSARRQPTDAVITALRLTVGAGVLVTLGLLAYSVAIKIFCPTCVVFYVLVAIAAYLAFVSVRAPSGAWGQSALLGGGLLLVTFAVLLYPGLHTPRENLVTARISDVAAMPAAQQKPASDLEQFLNSLPVGVQQVTSDTLALYRKEPLLDAKPNPQRLTYGTPDAPVHLIEWTDIRCPHCKNLEAALAEIRAISPAGSWSQETRHFPLDSECNTKVQRAAGGVSCLAAKVQICLAGAPDYASVRTRMFEEQATLTKERIWQIAAPDAARRKALEECVDAPATAATLKEDIEYADKYRIEGTPLVVVNGRKTAPVPALLLGLIMAKGRDDDPSFLVLPAPQRSATLP